MRLIDADALIDDLKHDVAMDEDSLCHEDLTDINRAHIQDDKDIKQNAIDLLNHAPTIEERKTGRWIWDDEGCHCSECFFHAYGNALECLDGTYRYCPHCGAKKEAGE